MKITKEILKDKRIALYGGSFNPIHVGHLLTAFYIKEELNYDLIIFIPANIPVHKETFDLIEAKHRIKMIELAIKDINYFLMSDIEIKRGGNSYTYDTVMELKEKYQYDGRFGIIIGDDLLDGLNKWKNIDLLQSICDLICLKRESKEIKTNYRINFVNNRVIEISSKEIRNRIKNRLSIDFMIPDKVKKYILKNKLYK